MSGIVTDHKGDLYDAETGKFVGVLNKDKDRTQAFIQTSPTPGGATSVAVSLSASRTIAAADDSTTFNCTTALPIVFPNGLSPKPSVIAVPPATGNLTLTPTGGATLNGSASSITRTFANNRLGVAITPNPYDVNDYSVSGS